MKKKFLYRASMFALLAGLAFACKKNSSNSVPGESTANLQTQSDDQARVDNESDAVANDVNLTLSSPGVSATSGAGFGGAVQTASVKSVISLICDATVTLDSTARIITITYNGGTNCALTRARTGTVTITLPPAGHKWSDQGAVITVNINNLRITRLKDGKSITLNGTHTYTNVSGGRLINLPALGTITHTITGDSMMITFDDNSQRIWSFARQRVYAFNNGSPTITTTGIHSDGTNTGIAEWGTTRYGNSFEAIITQPLVISEGCNFRLSSGSEEILRGDKFTTNITFGLDSTGNATSCPGDGFYYFKATWTAPGGKSGSIIWPY